MKNTITRAAKLDVDELKALCKQRELTLDLTWKWVGRNRHGLLQIRDDNCKLVVAVEYARNTQSWDSGDEEFNRVPRHSPRHAAVLSALKHLKALNTGAQCE
jgi:hypothetical protein